MPQLSNFQDDPICVSFNELKPICVEVYRINYEICDKTI